MYVYYNGWNFGRRSRERGRRFHRLERMFVATDVLVGRKERMWQIRESGKLLILSTDIGIER